METDSLLKEFRKREKALSNRAVAGIKKLRQSILNPNIH